MIRKLPTFCIAVFAACALPGCGSPDNLSPAMTSAEGYFLLADSGTPMIVMDSGAATMSAEEEDSLFDGFTDGDLIKIQFEGGIAESYPMQIHHIHKAVLIKDGSREDIPAAELDSLIEMGWIAG